MENNNEVQLSQGLSDDMKNLVIDMVRSEAFKYLERNNQTQIDNYRFLATQEPGAIPQEMRTWYSAKAVGREEVFQEIKEIINNATIRH